MVFSTCALDLFFAWFVPCAVPLFTLSEGLQCCGGAELYDYLGATNVTVLVFSVKDVSDSVISAIVALLYACLAHTSFSLCNISGIVFLLRCLILVVHP
jgi:hypothetical protein